VQILAGESEDRVTMHYCHAGGRTGAHTLTFRSSEGAGFIESLAITTIDRAGEPSLQQDFSCRPLAKSLRSLVADVVGSKVALRIAPIPPGDRRAPSGGAALRTIEEIEIAADDGTKVKCKVTRSMPSTC
jgi:hypothetical protein